MIITYAKFYKYQKIIERVIVLLKLVHFKVSSKIDSNVDFTRVFRFFIRASTSWNNIRCKILYQIYIIKSLRCQYHRIGFIKSNDIRVTALEGH